MALVVLRRFLTLSEAYAAAGALRSAGPHPAVFDEGYGTVVWIEQYYLGGFRLAVPAVEAQDAVEVLGEALRAARAAPADEDGNEEDGAQAAGGSRLGLTVLGLALQLTVGQGWSVTAVRQRPTAFRLGVLITFILLALVLVFGLRALSAA